MNTQIDLWWIVDDELYHNIIIKSTSWLNMNSIILSL